MKKSLTFGAQEYIDPGRGKRVMGNEVAWVLVLNLHDHSESRETKEHSNRREFPGIVDKNGPSSGKKHAIAHDDVRVIVGELGGKRQ